MKCNKCGADLCDGEKICQKCGYSSDNDKNKFPEYTPVCTPSYKSSYIPGSIPEEVYVTIKQPSFANAPKKSGVVVGSLSVVFIIAGIVLLVLGRIREKTSLLIDISGIVCLILSVVLMSVFVIKKKSIKDSATNNKEEVIYVTPPIPHEEAKKSNEVAVNETIYTEDRMKTNADVFKTRIAPEIKSSEDVFTTRIAPEIAHTSFEKTADESSAISSESTEENGINTTANKDIPPVKDEGNSSGEWFSSATDL